MAIWDDGSKPPIRPKPQIIQKARKRRFWRNPQPSAQEAGAHLKHRKCPRCGFSTLHRSTAPTAYLELVTTGSVVHLPNMFTFRTWVKEDDADNIWKLTGHEFHLPLTRWVSDNQETMMAEQWENPILQSLHWHLGPPT